MKALVPSLKQQGLMKHSWRWGVLGQLNQDTAKCACALPGCSAPEITCAGWRLNTSLPDFAGSRGRQQQSALLMNIILLPINCCHRSCSTSRACGLTWLLRPLTELQAHLPEASSRTGWAVGIAVGLPAVSTRSFPAATANR